MREFLVIAIALGGLLGAGIIFFSVRETIPIIVLLPVVLLSAALFPVLVRSFRKGADIFEPIHVIGWTYTLCYVIAPLLMVTLDIWMCPHIGDRYESLSRALFYTLLGVLMLYLGYWSRAGVRLAAIAPSPRPVTVRRIQTFALVYGVVGLVCYFAFMYLAGGLSNFYANVGWRVNFFSSRGYLLWGAILLLPAIALWFSALLHKGKTASIVSRFLFLLFFAVTVILFLILANRTRVVILFLLPVMIYHYMRSPISMRAVFIPVLSLFLVVAGPLHWFRIAPESVRTDPGLFAEFIYERLPTMLESVPTNLGYVEILMAILERFPEDVDYQWGKTYAAFLFSPIPRFLIPEIKPYGGGVIVTQTIFPELEVPNPEHPLENRFASSGVVPTLVGELYLNFSLPGVIAGMFVYGVLLRFLYAYLLRNRKNIGLILIFSFVSSTLIYQLSLGDFATAMAATFIYLIPVVLAVPIRRIRAVAAPAAYGRRRLAAEDRQGLRF